MLTYVVMLVQYHPSMEQQPYRLDGKLPPQGRSSVVAKIPCNSLNDAMDVRSMLANYKPDDWLNSYVAVAIPRREGGTYYISYDDLEQTINALIPLSRVQRAKSKAKALLTSLHTMVISDPHKTDIELRLKAIVEQLDFTIQTME